MNVDHRAIRHEACTLLEQSRRRIGRRARTAKTRLQRGSFPAIHAVPSPFHRSCQSLGALAAFAAAHSRTNVHRLHERSTADSSRRQRKWSSSVQFVWWMWRAATGQCDAVRRMRPEEESSGASLLSRDSESGPSSRLLVGMTVTDSDPASGLLLRMIACRHPERSEGSLSWRTR